MTITDGPFAQTKEQIGGFILVAARDLDEAIQLASGIPSVCLGGVEVEVRPIKKLTTSVPGCEHRSYGGARAGPYQCSMR
jgi:hypothetical protein